MSKYTIIWFILLLLSFGAATYFSGALSFCMLYFLLILPIVCLIYIFRQYRNISFEQKTDSKTMIAGVPEQYSFELKNLAAYTPYYNVQLNIADKHCDIQSLSRTSFYNLAPGETINKNTSIICKYRGSCQIGVTSIKIRDFLNFFCVPFNVKNKLLVFVMPQIVFLEQLKSIPEFESVQEDDTAFMKDEIDVPVRDYMSGDPLNRINWKATARERSLKTRLYTGIRNRKISVIVDTGTISGTEEQRLCYENKVLETAIALVRYFSTKDTDICTYYFQNLGSHKYSLVTGVVKSVTDFDLFYEKFSRLYFEPVGYNFLENIDIIDESIINSSIVLLITSEINDGVSEYASRLSRRGIRTNIYAITEKWQQKHLQAVNITYINPLQDIREVL
ncbi:MAG: DUF58 domain-containing protein [Lachnospiraceae bacterium]|nr:DUF58 domain-containing protein [Lachnospiraceae bacterium]